MFIAIILDFKKSTCEEKVAYLFLGFKTSANITRKHKGKMRGTRLYKINSQYLSSWNLNEKLTKFVNYSQWLHLWRHIFVATFGDDPSTVAKLDKNFTLMNI